MKLNVPPLVATSLLNDFEDFVKTPLSFKTYSILNKKFFGDVSTAGILVHCRLGTSAEAQPMLPLPQVPLTGLPEPFHACSS